MRRQNKVAVITWTLIKYGVGRLKLERFVYSMLCHVVVRCSLIRSSEGLCSWKCAIAVNKLNFSNPNKIRGKFVVSRFNFLIHSNLRCFRFVSIDILDSNSF